MAIRLAVVHRGWPTASVVPAMLAIAADSHTRSPGRLAEAGPWWDQPALAEEAVDEVSNLEQRLDDIAGRRPALQAQARAELTAEELPLTKATVVRRACEILDRQETT
jgi:ParB-like chromosome segregation protein Spo0J